MGRWVGGVVKKCYFKITVIFCKLLSHLPTAPPTHLRQLLKKRKIVKRKASLKETVTDLSTARDPYKGKLLLKRSATLHDLAFFLFGKAVGKAVDGWVGRWVGGVVKKCYFVNYCDFFWQITLPPTHRPTHPRTHLRKLLLFFVEQLTHLPTHPLLYDYTACNL